MKILETINNVGGCDGDSEYDKGWDAAIGEVYSVVEAMEYHLLEWIPVEERLPEGGEVVQVTVRRGWVDVGYYDESREEWWTLDDNGLMDVIAWQPMAELALEACKKQVPQKTKNALYGEKDKQLWAAECPICGILQSPSNMYCDKCGQRLLWDAPTGELSNG